MQRIGSRKGFAVIERETNEQFLQRCAELLARTRRVTRELAMRIESSLGLPHEGQADEEELAGISRESGSR